MFTMILATALASQVYQIPRPQYNPAGYYKTHPDFVGAYVSGVGNPKVIHLEYPKPRGIVLGSDGKTSMLRVRLDDGEIVLVHYGPTTIFKGRGKRVEIDKPNRTLTFTE